MSTRNTVGTEHAPLSSTRIGVLLMMEVVVGTIAITLLSAEPVATIQIMGAALILAAGIIEVISRDAIVAFELPS